MIYNGLICRSKSQISDDTGFKIYDLISHHFIFLGPKNDTSKSRMIRPIMETWVGLEGDFHEIKYTIQFKIVVECQTSSANELGVQLNEDSVIYLGGCCLLDGYWPQDSNFKRGSFFQTEGVKAKPASAFTCRTWTQYKVLLSFFRTLRRSKTSILVWLKVGGVVLRLAVSRHKPCKIW